MFRENIEINWVEIAGKLKEKFSKLKEADLVFVKGKEDELIRKIQLRLLKSRREVLEIIGTL